MSRKNVAILIATALAVGGACSSRPAKSKDGGPDSSTDGPGPDMPAGVGGGAGQGGSGGSTTGVAGTGPAGRGGDAGTSGNAGVGGASGTSGNAGGGGAGRGGTSGNTGGGGAGGGAAGSAGGTTGSGGATAAFLRYPAYFGRINALVASDTTVYAGGAFQSLGPPYQLAAIDAAAGAARAWPARVTGTATAAVADGMGGFYIGGANVTVDDGRTYRDYLAHVRGDGSIDGAFTPPADFAVKALALSGGVLYAAGVANAVPWQVAALDATTGALRTFTPPDLPSDKGTISSLAVAGNMLYVGGKFQSLGDAARVNLAVLDVTTGALQPQAPVIDGNLTAMAASGSTIYLAGTFTHVGGLARAGAAAVDAATAAPTAWNPNRSFDGDGFFLGVSALAVRGTATYLVGQNVARVGAASQLYDGVGAFDATTGDVLWTAGTQGGYLPIAPLAVGSPRPVQAVAADANAVYVGGNFTSVSGQSRTGLVALAPSTGAVAPWLPPNAWNWATVDTLIDAGGTLLAMGTGGSVATGGIAALDGTTGSTVVSFGNDLLNVFNVGLSGNRLLLAGPRARAVDTQTGLNLWTLAATQSVAVAGTADTFFVAGEFQNVAGTGNTGLAAFDAATGARKPWDPVPGIGVAPLSMTPAAIAVAGGVVYFAGSFSIVGDQNRAGLAAVSATTGALATWNPRPNNATRALVISGGAVYVSGTFTTIAGTQRNRVAALDPTTATALPWNPDANGAVNAMAIVGDIVYLGGMFNQVGGQARDGLAAVSRTTGAVLPWAPTTPFSLGDITSLAVAGNHVFAGSVSGLAILEPAR
ncbi:MAG TPA: hypothetical protein VN903_32155 [Polyangia bacterium]|nr:hypothetical protein [Polyangia bacterium]